MLASLLAGANFARAHWKLFGIGLLCLALAVQSLRLGAANNRADRIQINLNECRKGRADDRAAYQDAQRKAAEINQAEVRSTEQQYKDANDETKRDLNSRLERLRGELRKGNAAPQGNPDRPGTSQNPGGPGTPQAAGLCLTPEEHVLGAENEERHDQLITLIEKLLKVER